MLGHKTHLINLKRLKVNQISSPTTVLYMKHKEAVLGDWLAMIFGFDTKGKGNKEKHKQVGSYQTKNVLYSKGNHQQNKMASYRIRENICKLRIW